MRKRVASALSDNAVVAPMALRDRARRFLRAATLLMQNDPLGATYAPVTQILLAQSIELTLKAFLSARALTQRRLKTCHLRHDLEELLIEAGTFGLDRFVRLTPEEHAEISAVGKGFRSGLLRYSLRPPGAPFQRLEMGDRIVLHRAANRLLKAIRKPCLDATLRQARGADGRK